MPAEKKNKFALLEGAVWGDKIFQDGVSLDQLEGLMHPNHARKMGDLYEKFARLNRLRDTVLQGDVDGARRILDENKMCVDVPVRDDEKNIFMTLLGLIALRPALKNGVKLMEMLIAHKASINARSDLGQTALILACKAKNIPAAQLLIANGARLNAVDRNGWSAMCASASLVDGQEPTEFGMASSVLIDLLITNGAAKDGEEDPANQEVRKSAVPLMVAVQYNNYHALLTLMQSGACVSQEPLLHQALHLKRSVNYPIIQALTHGGCNPHITDEDGKIPLHVATEMYGKSDQVSKLIRDATDRWEALFNVARPKFEDEVENAIEEEQGPEIAGLIPEPVGPKGFKGFIKKCEQPCKDILKNPAYQFTMFVCLMLALFLPDFYVVMDVEAQPLEITGDLRFTSLDVILIIIIFLFFWEIVFQVI